MSAQQDHWSAAAYSSAASFVPQLTTTVLSYLDPQPSDRILDLGCGDGQLTAQIARAAHQGHVLGLDASESFITTAKEQYTDVGNCEFRLQDCTRVKECAEAVDGSWDKVFSNAALHWILRKEETRVDVLRDAHAALRPGGLLVFEMGGQGNCAEMYAAFTSALLHAGVPLQTARAAAPWFFPSREWMRAHLSDVGFAVEVCEIEYRPTKFTAETGDGRGGVEGWVRLMGAGFLEVVEVGRREAVVREVCDVVRDGVRREESGESWIGYVRLRVVARKR